MNFIKKLRYLPFAIILVVGFFLVMKTLHRDPSLQPPMENSPWALNTVKVTQGTVTAVFPALGQVESASELKIAPQISGTVLKMGPRQGGLVKKGDLLVQIDSRELNASLGALKADLASAQNTARTAQKEYQRELKLLKEGGTSQSAVDARETKQQTALSKVSALKNKIKALQIKISYGKILAPLDSSVTKRNAEIGDTVFAGKPIYTLSAEKGGRVIVPIPLSTLINVKTGTHIELLNGKQRLQAEVTRINPSLDKNSMGRLEIDLSEKPFNLPDGSPVSTNVITQEIHDALIVPADALVPSDNPLKRAIFRVKQGDKTKYLEKVILNILLCGREGCAVQGNIQQNDEVVRGHSSVLLRLHNGDAVYTDWKAGELK